MAAVLSTPPAQAKQKQTETALGLLEFSRCFIAQAKGILHCKKEEGGGTGLCCFRTQGLCCGFKSCSDSLLGIVSS